MLIPRQPYYREAQPSDLKAPGASKNTRWDILDVTEVHVLAHGVEGQTAFEAYRNAKIGLSFASVRVRQCND